MGSLTVLLLLLVAVFAGKVQSIASESGLNSAHPPLAYFTTIPGRMGLGPP